MFIVFMKFGPNKQRAGELMAEHVRWIKRGIQDGAFLATGSLPEEQGGVILSDGISREALEQRLSADPFIQHAVVSPEITDVAIGLSQEKVSFLVR